MIPGGQPGPRAASLAERMRRDAERLGDLRTAAWDALRAFTADPNAATALPVVSAAEVLDGACERFRREYAHPEATEVFVTCDHAIGQELFVWQRRSWGNKSVTEAIYPPESRHTS